MCKILIATDGPLGMRYSCIELARRLAAAGHAVTCAGLPGDRPLAEHHGLDFLPLEHPGLATFYARDDRHAFTQRWRTVPVRRRAARQATGADAFAAVLDELGPDLVLLDQEMQEQIVVTAASGRALALLNTCASIWRRSGLPPLHTRIRPGTGLRGTQAGMSLAWTGFRLRKRLKALRLRLRRVGCDRQALLRDIARDYDFDLPDSTDTSQWLIPFTYPALPVLTLHALEFDFPHAPAPRVHYVGPQSLRDRRPDRLADGDRRRLDRILGAHADAAPDRALIYAGFGSYFSANRSWLRRLIAAVGARPGWTLVLSLGGKIDPEDLGELPPNVHAFPWLPQLEVLDEADAAVVHGGINTIDECVLARVPMLVCAGEATDMGGNTARVLYHGIGLAADPQRDTEAGIRAQLDRLLGDARIRRALGRLEGAYRDYKKTR